MPDEKAYVRIPVARQACLRGRAHAGHLWLPLPSLTYNEHLPSEAIRYCEGEAMTEMPDETREMLERAERAHYPWRKETFKQRERIVVDVTPRYTVREILPSQVVKEHNEAIVALETTVSRLEGELAAEHSKAQGWAALVITRTEDNARLRTALKQSAGRLNKFMADWAEPHGTVAENDFYRAAKTEVRSLSAALKEEPNGE